MSEIRIPRRTALKGLGAVVALPLLDAMIPMNVFASAEKKRPNRMMFISVPNGVNMKDWKPAEVGTNYALPYILEPLQKVKDSIVVMSGLTQDKARPNGDGAGDHARSAAAWLTGCQPRKTSGSNIKVGVSVDQLAAQLVGKANRFPSIEIGCERGGLAGDCDSGYSCAYSSSIAWRGESTPVGKEVNPRSVFDRLFGTGDSNETPESRERNNSYRKSILDYVLEDTKQLQAKLGINDQHKLDEYLTSVREIEMRLARTEQFTQEVKLSGGKVPVGVPAEYGDHVRLMYDIMLLAFQTDQTRICTFMYANEGSNRNYSQIGITDGHHDLSHHGRDPKKLTKLREINHYQISHLAYFLEKLQAVKEGSGTLLENSMIVFGSGISDGDMHNHNDLPVLFAGKGGNTIKTGRHVKYDDNTPMTNLFLCMLDRMGVHPDKLGDSTGRLEQLV